MGQKSELYGRALVVIAAEQYASRLAVPTSQRMPAMRWGSHKDLAAKALRKLAGPHVPASLTKLEQAVKRAHSAHAHHAEQKAARQRAAQLASETDNDGGVGAEEAMVDEDLDAEAV